MSALNEGLSQLLSTVRRLETARLEAAALPTLDAQTVYERADAIAEAIAHGDYEKAYGLAVEQGRAAFDAGAERTRTLLVEDYRLRGPRYHRQALISCVK